VSDERDLTGKAIEDRNWLIKMLVFLTAFAVFIVLFVAGARADISFVLEYNNCIDSCLYKSNLVNGSFNARARFRAFCFEDDFADCFAYGSEEQVREFKDCRERCSR